MTAGSLFSGIGGFDLGFEQAGFNTFWQVEIDDKCLTTLSKHFPNAQRYTDVTEVGSHNLSPVDVITGGFPCQDLSVAGKRAGLAGDRSGLWFHFHRILQELTPRWAVIENVPGLLSSNGGRDFAVVLRGLEDIGYHASWRVLDAQYAGVAQRRRRVFVVASLGDYSCISVLFESEGVSWNPPSRQKAGKGVAYSLRANPSHSGDKGDGGINTTLINDVAPTLSSSGTGTSRTGNDRTEADFCVVAKPIAFDWSVGAKTRTLGESVNLSPTIGAEKQPAVCTTIRSSGPMNDDNAAQAGHLVSVTLTQQGSQSCDPEMEPLTPTQNGVRRLTPTECERLQGFPDGWTAIHKDTNRYKQLGNAVAVPVAEWIAKRIAARTPQQ